MSSPGVLRLGRVWSVPVLVRPGVLLMGAVLVLLAAPRLDAAGYGAAWLIAVLGVLSVYASVLVHELAHVAVARHHDVAVRSVTLHLLGGETLVEGDSRTPAQEFTTAASGPAASAALGLLGVLGGGLLGAHDVADIVSALGWINLVVAGVNILPALPLDGGRVLRAVVWRLSGNELTGVFVAGWIGRAAAVATAVAGGWLLLRGSEGAWIDVTLCLVVALFLWQGSTQSLRTADRARRVARLHAGRLADSTAPEPHWPRLSADLRGTELLRAMTQEPAEAYGVVESSTGDVLGTLRTRTVNRSYRVGARR